MLNLSTSYFAIDNPLRLLERRFDRFQHRQSIRINQRELEVRWTERAERELRSARQPLVVELQLYFSCVVKKRVVFHQQVDFESAAVTRQLFITVGLVGLLILGLLTVTSNRWAMRSLGKNWRRLHRLVYLAGGAVVIHALLAVSMSKKMFIRDPQAVHELRIYLDILVVLLLVRIPQVRRFLSPIRMRKTQPTQPVMEIKPVYHLQDDLRAPLR